MTLVMDGSISSSSRRKKKDWSKDLDVRGQLIHGNKGLGKHHGKRYLELLEVNSDEWKTLKTSMNAFSAAGDLHKSNIRTISDRKMLESKVTDVLQRVDTLPQETCCAIVDWDFHTKLPGGITSLDRINSLWEITNMHDVVAHPFDYIKARNADVAGSFHCRTTLFFDLFLKKVIYPTVAAGPVRFILLEEVIGQCTKSMHTVLVKLKLEPSETWYYDELKGCFRVVAACIKVHKGEVEALDEAVADDVKLLWPVTEGVRPTGPVPSDTGVRELFFKAMRDVPAFETSLSFIAKHMETLIAGHMQIVAITEKSEAYATKDADTGLDVDDVQELTKLFKDLPATLKDLEAVEQICGRVRPIAMGAVNVFAGDSTFADRSAQWLEAFGEALAYASESLPLESAILNLQGEVVAQSLTMASKDTITKSHDALYGFALNDVTRVSEETIKPLLKQLKEMKSSSLNKSHCLSWQLFWHCALMPQQYRRAMRC